MLINLKHLFDLLHGFFPTSMVLFEILLFTLLLLISLYLSFPAGLIWIFEKGNKTIRVKQGGVLWPDVAVRCGFLVYT